MKKLSKYATLGNYRHGMRHSKFYEVWKGMKARCGNKNHMAYGNYGARGIRVCDRWMKFENFMEDMIPDYRLGLTIDRIDNDGNYSPENCKWVTRREQANNTRHNLLIFYEGKRKTLAQWALEKGIRYQILYKNLYRYSIPFERAITMKSTKIKIKNRSKK